MPTEGISPVSSVMVVVTRYGRIAKPRMVRGCVASKGAAAGKRAGAKRASRGVPVDDVASEEDELVRAVETRVEMGMMALEMDMSQVTQLDDEDMGVADGLVEEEETVPSVEARLALGFEPTGPVVGRLEELTALEGMLGTLVQPGVQARSLYVCGTPGTGKTFAVSRVVAKLRTGVCRLANSADVEGVDSQRACTFKSCGVLRVADPVKCIWVNCATLAQPRDLFKHVMTELDVAAASASSNSALDAVRTFAASQGPKVVLVLDEVDFLTSSDQMVLYSAFEWPKIADSRLVVVGIANSTDLPVRLLPWLRAGGCMPELFPFAPYDAVDLERIVSQRLGSKNDGDTSCTLSAKAISLAAKKVAAGPGDARLVLDVCREAILQMQRQNGSGSLAANGIVAVSTILNRRGGMSAAVDTIRQLPVQQQLAVIVAANAAISSSCRTPHSKTLNKKATLGGLFESFTRLCARARVSCVSFADFADICCNALAHHGLVDTPPTRGKNTARTLRTKAVRLRVPVADVRVGVADRGFLPLLIAED